MYVYVRAHARICKCACACACVHACVRACVRAYKLLESKYGEVRGNVYTYTMYVYMYIHILYASTIALALQ